jgi:HSP20 family protein
VWRQAGFSVCAEVPGFREEEIEVRAEPRRIYISGERKDEPGRKKGTTIYSEWGSNQISRWFELPAEIDFEKVKATLSDGVLELTLQKARAARKIHVESKAA